MKSCLARCIILVCLTTGMVGLPAGASVVFTNNFDGVLPLEMAPGVAALTGVQGYAGLGPVGNQFGGSFLRSPTGNIITLALSNLPPHTALNFSMLFAAIDSLDGTGTFPSGDFFKMTLDTNIVFRESFANATDTQIQSYVPPPGAQLARRVDLGFSGPGGYFTDSAYDFGVDSRFSNLAHTNSTAIFTFQIEGEGIQDLNDESWAMDNLAISTTQLAQPVITRILPLGNNVTVTWSSLSGVTYRVQSKTNLSDAVWNDLTPLVTATNFSTDFTELRDFGSRFYRVMVVP
jgi:hypothetical protein